MGDGRPCAALNPDETGARAPVFFRPDFGRTQNFTMWKIFLPRKKSCCVAQRGYCSRENHVSQCETNKISD
jgi:hypothetical protein